MNAHCTHAAGRMLFFLLALVLSIGMGFGCASRGEKSRKSAPILTFDRTVEDFLHCKQKRCEAWYRLELEEPTRLTVEANGPASRSLPDFVLELLNSHIEVIGDDVAPQHRPRRVTRSLGPNWYWVRLRAVG